MLERTLRILAGVLLIGATGGIFGLIAASPGEYLPDFSTYYYAYDAFSHGGNPYDVTVPAGPATPSLPVRFVYPPHALLLFSWTNGVSIDRARIEWLIAKGFFLIGLLLCWRAILRGESPDVVFFAFAAMAFNAAILTDIRTGNVTIIEQAFLWGGFLALTRERRVLFAVLVAASALFKLTNGAFLLLLVFAPPRRILLPLAAGGIGILGPLILSSLVWPPLFTSFLTSANGLVTPGERGWTNPCLWAFLADMRDNLSSLTGREVPPAAVGLLFAANGLFVLTVSGSLLKKLARSSAEGRLLYAVSLACLALPLVLPRFKDYSFIQLIPPSYLLLRRAGSERISFALLAFIICAPTLTAFRFLMPFSVYHLVFVTYGLWILMVVYIRNNVTVAPAG
jgi:hypothetical protein